MLNLASPVSGIGRFARAVARYGLLVRLYRNWWTVYRNRLRRPSGGQELYRLRSGEEFLLEDGLHDVRILTELWFDRAYEPVPDFRLRRGWNVIDAGAHKGVFAVRASRAGARVIAVEPEPSNSAALNLNLQRNGCSGVEVLQAALWSEAGEATLHHFGSGGSTDFSLVLGSEETGETVKTVTLEALVEQLGHVDLLKLDIEGAELAVLRSTPPRALRNIDRIVMDYLVVGAPEQGEGIAREIAAFLARFDFSSTIQRQGCIFYATRKSDGARSEFVPHP